MSGLKKNHHFKWKELSFCEFVQLLTRLILSQPGIDHVIHEPTANSQKLTQMQSTYLVYLGKYDIELTLHSLIVSVTQVSATDSLSPNWHNNRKIAVIQIVSVEYIFNSWTLKREDSLRRNFLKTLIRTSFSLTKICLFFLHSF